MKLEALIQALAWTLIHSVWLAALAGAIQGLVSAHWRERAPQRAYLVGVVLMLGLVLTLGAVFLLQWDQRHAALDLAALQAARAALPMPGQVAADLPVVAAAGTLSGDVWWALLVGAWALGVCWHGYRVLTAHIALRRLVMAATPLPQWQAVALGWAQRMGIRAPVRVLGSALAQVPFVLGYWRPVIVLPLTVAAGMPMPQIEAILAHELAHLKRADVIINWLQIGCELLLFFHPAVRWMSADLRDLRERCCDDAVLSLGSRRGDYARALLQLEAFRQHTPLTAPAATAGALLLRIERIVGEPRKLSFKWRKSLLVLAASLGVLALAPWRLSLNTAELASLPRLALPELLRLELQPELPLAAPSAEMALSASGPAPAQAIALPRAMLIEPMALDPAAARLALAADPLRPSAAPRRANAGSAPISSGIAQRPEGPLPVTMVQPVYPGRSQLKGSEGEVVLRYRVDRQGQVYAISVVSAPRDQAFERAARAALNAWRYQPADAALWAGRELQQRFDFRLGAPSASTPAIDECVRVTGSRLCRPWPN